MKPTPAQVFGHPDFNDSFGPGGPTDPGMRAADCWYRNNVLPAHPACVDCKGPIPMWAQSGVLGERLSFGGRGSRGFALEAPGDPDIWSFNVLTPDQKTWVVNTLTGLNNRIYQSTNTTCPTWKAPTVDNIFAATGCFQAWFNSVQTAGAPVTKLRTDGVFDQDTLNALITTAQIHATDFPAFPGTVPGAPGSPSAVTTASVIPTGLSTGMKVGLAVGGAALVGGVVYATHHGGHKKSRRRRRR